MSSYGRITTVPDDPAIREIILHRLDKIEAKIDDNTAKTARIEQKIAYFAGFFTAAGVVLSTVGHKIYGLLFGS
jgi:tetrahydromethanopterin S-methyltransferase subunit G